MRAMISPPSSVRPPDPLLADLPLNDPPLSGAPVSRWQIALLWVGVPLCAFGLFHYRLWDNGIRAASASCLLLSLLAWGLSWPLRRFAGWSSASALALPWCLALALFAGVVPVAATLVLAATAIALGGMLADPRIACAAGGLRPGAARRRAGMAAAIAGALPMGLFVREHRTCGA